MKYDNLYDTTSREYQLFNTYLTKEIERKEKELKRYKNLDIILTNKLQYEDYSEEEFMACISWLNHSNEEINTIIKKVFGR